MINRKLKIIIGAIIILAQIIFFRNYLPFQSDNIVIDGQACTCPNAQVISGRYFLKTHTPDSLLKYNLDYSEIYFENAISTSSDPMGGSKYIINGQVVGKGSISEGDGHYYPLFKIDNYNYAIIHYIIQWFVIGILLVQLFMFFNLIKLNTKNYLAQNNMNDTNK